MIHNIKENWLIKEYSVTYLSHSIEIQFIKDIKTRPVNKKM